MQQLLVRVSDIIGFIGVILTLSAYYFVNTSKWSSESLSYLLFNLVGSSFLMFSLMFNWNLPAVLIEVAWISISIIGLYRYWKRISSSELEIEVN